MRFAARRLAGLAAMSCGLLLLGGCASRGDLQARIQNDLVRRQPDQAVVQLQQATVLSTDRVLYLLRNAHDARARHPLLANKGLGAGRLNG